MVINSPVGFCGFLWNNGTVREKGDLCASSSVFSEVCYRVNGYAVIDNGFGLGCGGF